MGLRCRRSAGGRLLNNVDDASVFISYVDRSLQDAISPFADLGTNELRACRVGQAVRIGLANVNAVAEIGKGLDCDRA